MMKRGTGCLLIVTAMGLAWMVSSAFSAPPKAAAAAPPPPTLGTRVAVVDMVKVFNDFKQTKALNKKMDDYKKQLNAEGEKRMEDINALKAQLQAVAPDSADFFKRNKELKLKKFDNQVWEMTEMESLAESHLRWVKKTYKMVTDEVAQVAKKKGIQLVITREELEEPKSPDAKTQLQAMFQQIINRKVVYSDPAIEITDEVLSSLNAAYEKAGGEKSVDPAK